jgi:hypothetical protein
MGMLGSAEEVTDGRRRRRRVCTAVAARSPAKEQVQLGNTWPWKLHGVPVEQLGGSVGSGFKWEIELNSGRSAAAAGTQTPASRQPGKAYTRACKLPRPCLGDTGVERSSGSPKECQWRATAARCSREERR